MVDYTQVFLGMLSLAGTVVTGFVIPWLLSRLSAEQLNKARQWTEIAVKAAEQIYSGPGRGEEKMKYVTEFLNLKGVTFDKTTVEAAVRDLGWSVQGVIEESIQEAFPSENNG